MLSDFANLCEALDYNMNFTSVNGVSNRLSENYG